VPLHDVHDVALGPEYEFSEQLMQWFAGVATYVPEGHGSHVTPKVNWPAAHAMHGLPSPEYVPAAHAVHGLPPTEVVPAAHAVHGLPPTEVVFAAHAVHVVAPATEVVFVGHDVHLVS